MKCGRVDPHRQHEVSLPRRLVGSLTMIQVEFTCHGPPRIEGGHHAKGAIR